MGLGQSRFAGFYNNADNKMHVQGFHPVFRVRKQRSTLGGTRGPVCAVRPKQKEKLSGIPFRSGCTVVAARDGTVRYVISKPMLGGESVNSGDGVAVWNAK